jgi:hypothetical protein
MPTNIGAPSTKYFVDQTVSRWYVILPDVVLFEPGFQNIIVGVLWVTRHAHAGTAEYFLAV